MQTAGYATAHDALVAKKLAYVMCGGDLSEPALVSEQYLLDLERSISFTLRRKENAGTYSGSIEERQTNPKLSGKPSIRLLLKRLILVYTDSPH